MTARMRHGVVDSSTATTVDVQLDGVVVTAFLLDGVTLSAGMVATLVQDGRRLVALGAVAAPGTPLTAITSGEDTTASWDAYTVDSDGAQPWQWGQVYSWGADWDDVYPGELGEGITTNYPPGEDISGNLTDGDTGTGVECRGVNRGDAAEPRTVWIKLPYEGIPEDEAGTIRFTVRIEASTGFTGYLWGQGPDLADAADDSITVSAGGSTHTLDVPVASGDGGGCYLIVTSFNDPGVPPISSASTWDPYPDDVEWMLVTTASARWIPTA